MNRFSWPRSIPLLAWVVLALALVGLLPFAIYRLALAAVILYVLM